MAVNGVGASQDWFIQDKTLGSSSVITGKDSSQMSMDDFFSLLTAQMTNQDMLNPQTDTDYIAQMAQFTTLQGINTIMEYQLSSYASSYAGKTVSIAYTGENGQLTKTEGLVSSVSFYDGEPKVVVNGVSYPLYSVMEIKSGASSSTGGTGETADPDEIETADGITMESASAYIGKNVTVEFEDGDGTDTAYGKVTGLSRHENGKVQVIIDGEAYYASRIIEVEGIPLAEEDDE
ncbi:MAG: hypothetical protein LBU86_00075 [Oscillospiraceae bacterium]|jgi:flagellar basal-body rod modification protein FlgD|nr:hypothetical protein [Oscillospiraceae bacterium]